MKTALTIAVIIVGLVIVVSILMQPSKSDALSGLIMKHFSLKIKQEQRKLCLKD